MARFRNWIATFGSLALGVAALPNGVGAESASPAMRPMVEPSTPGLPPAINGVAPGPEILHRPPARAPQFENTGVWEAEPTKVCLTSAYRAGEFLYQDCLWDDNGGGPAYRWWYYTAIRTYEYPTNPAYRNNAADLVEVRLKPLADATAIRVTYNTMTDPNLAAVTIALGGDAGQPVDVPHGANTKMPAQVFVTAHGNEGDVVDAATGEPRPERPTVTADVERRQVDIRVPYSAFDPRGNTAVRVGAAAGLWDAAGQRYLVPNGGQATGNEPGGGTSGRPSAFFNAAFRYDEPYDAAWRDHHQLAAIEKGDISPFFATVDFTKLAAGADDDMAGQRGGVPTTGFMNMLFASHFERNQGRRIESDPNGPRPLSFSQQNGMSRGAPGENERPGLAFGWPCRDDCTPDLAGQLQRYLVYVPKVAPPPTGYATLLWLGGYAINAGDVVYGERDLYRSVGDRPDNPTLVVGTDARGADQWAYGQSGASNFETWADVARRFKLDASKTALGGFSSGAYSANKLALTFPDVFGKAFPCDGLDVAPSFPTQNGVADELPFDTTTVHEPGSRVSEMLPSRRNQPVMEWAGSTDDFIPYNITRRRADLYAAGDYDYEFVTWHGVASGHLLMCNNGTWDVFTKWLGDMKRVVDPVHVTYVRNPLMDDPGAGLVGNRAYWLSGIETRDRALGTIDVVSAGFDTGPAQRATQKTENHSIGSDGLYLSTGFDQPDRRPALPENLYTREYRHSGSGPAHTPSDVLTITAKNIGTLVIDPQRAKVSCRARLDVTTDGPLSITLLGCGGGPLTFG
jgi:predicted esterase